MVCQHCKSELTKAPVYRFVNHQLIVRPGYECRKCGAIYDEDGTQLEPPYSQRDPEEESDGE